MPLTLNGTTGIAYPNGSAAAPALSGTDTDTGIIFGTDTVALATAGTQRLTVISNGNVGIGTTNPTAAYMLHTYGAGGNIGFHLSSQSCTLRYSNTNTSAEWSAGTSSPGLTNAGNYYSITQLGTDSTWRERLVIDSSGNVGIGTANPSSKLDVRGIVRINGNSGGNYPQTLEINAHNDLTSTTITSNPTTNHDGGGGLRLVSSLNTGNYGAGIYFDHGTLGAAITSARLVTNNWGTDLRFYTHPTTTDNQFLIYERMRIIADGSVGIGITNPGAKLHVAGGNIKVDSGYGIDFSATSNASGMASELFDDYETGTWTPQIKPDGTFNTFTPWTATSSGTYTKIGRTVHLKGNINYTAKTTAGNYAFMNGFPFLPSAQTEYFFVTITGAGGVFYQLTISAVGNGSFLKDNGGGAFGPLIGNELGPSTGVIQFEFVYQV